jgi:polysaccharide chain length determinant protein (PEP-CTERM system associated)
MLPGRIYTPDDIKGILWRGRWWILLPFALGLAMTPVIASYLPKLYRSETLLMVIPQRIPDSYVRSTVTDSVQDRLFSISDQILSRSRLERIIIDYGLYPEERRIETMEDVVGRMRLSIVVLPPGREQSFRVSYTSVDPATAQKVTARLASMFIEENIRERGNLAENTSVFLESQLEEAKVRLQEQEKKLEIYRRANTGELPSQLSTNLQGIQNGWMQVQNINESMNRAKERRLLIERELADLIPATPSAEGSESSTPPLSVVLLPSEQPLAEAKARLEEYRLRYTPNHPDIRALERTIRELEQRVKNEALVPRTPDTRPTKEKLAQAAAYDRAVRDLRRQLDDIDRQLKGYEEEAERARSEIKSYQARVESVPTRESELVELTRDYDTLHTLYTGLLAKQEDSKLAANLERRQIGEQFRILDPASLPERPYNQRKRLTTMFSAAIGGVILGLLFIAFRELRDSSFKLEQDVLRTLDLPVLALVPVMASDHERRVQRWRAIVVNVAGSAVLIGSVVFVVMWSLHS